MLRVGFYRGEERCAEDFPFPGSLRACLECLGEDFGCEHTATGKPDRHVGCSYAYITGASGIAFRLLWNPNEWDFGNCDVMRMAEDPLEPFRRAFQAVGYRFEAIFKDEYASLMGIRQEARYDETDFRGRLVQSIRDWGCPVIAIGVLGPPECCVVTGYDEGGDVILGWSYFQDMPEFNAGIEFEPSGYFRKRNWYKDTSGLIIIGDRATEPPINDILYSSLQWALQVVHTPKIRDYYNGLAAYEAWAEALAKDEEFPLGEIDSLRAHYMVHNDAVGTVAEGRWYGAEYLRRMAKQLPIVAEPLLGAARCYLAEHDLMWEIWKTVGGNNISDDQVRNLAEAQVRRQVVPLILRARDKDREAAGHLEKALESLQTELV